MTVNTVISSESFSPDCLRPVSQEV